MHTRVHDANPHYLFAPYSHEHTHTHAPTGYREPFAAGMTLARTQSLTLAVSPTLTLAHVVNLTVSLTLAVTLTLSRWANLLQHGQPSLDSFGQTMAVYNANSEHYNITDVAAHVYCCKSKTKSVSHE